MTAIISACGLYRYRLERDGPGEGQTAVIMVNPSTADSTSDDATIRKLRGFGARNGWGRILVGNLFAYRATDVRELAKVADPVGPDNNGHLLQIMSQSDRLVVAWGPVKSKLPKHLRPRWEEVVNLFAEHPWLVPQTIGPPAMCGHPKHPLMLAYALEMESWQRPK